MCYRLTALSQKASRNGVFFNEKTSFNGILGLIAHILSFQKLQMVFWATLGIMFKNCVLSRKVKIFIKIMKNRCFASPDPKNGHIIAYEVSKCAYNLAESREKNKLR